MGPKPGPRTHSLPSTLVSIWWWRLETNHVGEKLVNVGHVCYVGDEIGQQKRASNFVARIVFSLEIKKMLLY